MRIVLGHKGASPDFKRKCDCACSLMHLLQENTLGSQQTNSCFVATCQRRRIISFTLEASGSPLLPNSNHLCEFAASVGPTEVSVTPTQT